MSIARAQLDPGRKATAESIFDASSSKGAYRVCEDLPLSDRHAEHILARLKKAA